MLSSRIYRQIWANCVFPVYDTNSLSISLVVYSRTGVSIRALCVKNMAGYADIETVEVVYPMLIALRFIDAQLGKGVPMNGVSLDRLLQLQEVSTSASVLSGDSTVNSQTFASLLAEQLDTNDGSATSGEVDIRKEMILNTCLMMCEGGNSGPMMMSLYSALSGSLDSEAIAGLQGISTGSLMGTLFGSSKNPVGESVVQAAMTRLGDPYSTTYRGQGDYVDCSSLVQWAYGQTGVSLPSTSVKQAKYCYDNGYTISKSELQPGDLIFWSNKESTEGRWMNIHHVGIYAGNGKVIEAKGSAGGVVIDDIWGENGSKWEITMYARPQATASESE